MPSEFEWNDSSKKLCFERTSSGKDMCHRWWFNSHKVLLLFMLLISLTLHLGILVLPAFSSVLEASAAVFTRVVPLFPFCPFNQCLSLQDICVRKRAPNSISRQNFRRDHSDPNGDDFRSRIVHSLCIWSNDDLTSWTLSRESMPLKMTMISPITSNMSSTYVFSRSLCRHFVSVMRIIITEWSTIAFVL